MAGSVVDLRHYPRDSSGWAADPSTMGPVYARISTPSKRCDRPDAGMSVTFLEFGGPDGAATDAESWPHKPHYVN
jgi:hypothetical protein